MIHFLDPETVILGNHRDAWVFGAGDPMGGSCTLLELARCFSKMREQGWKPLRSIVLASWDGEEYGLLGSSAYADANAAFLQKSVVAYLNVDINTGNQLFVGATHSLDNLINSVTKRIQDPDTNKTIYEVWDKQIGTLGSGSDYTSFIHRHGVASIDFGFVAPNGEYDGVYHSIYDSLYWIRKFSHDSEFHYKVAQVQMWGLFTLRLADGGLLSFNYSDSADVFQQYLNQVNQSLFQQGGEKFVDLSSITTTIQKLRTANDEIYTRIRDWNLTGPVEKDRLNSALFTTERSFLGPGLPERPYYRNVIQAPHLLTGYGSQPFPGIDQSIFRKDWPEAQRQVNILSQRIEAAATNLVDTTKWHYHWIWIILACAIVVCIIIYALVVAVSKGLITCSSRNYEQIE